MPSVMDRRTGWGWHRVPVPTLGRDVDVVPGGPRRVQVEPLHLAVALVCPVGVAAALIPLRGDLAHSAGIVLVLPVAFLALRWGPLYGVIAAAAAAAGFDLLLTQPYLSLNIRSADDVVATITLLAVGLSIGLAGSQLARLDRRARSRLDELAVLSDHLDLVNRAPGRDEVLARTAGNLTRLLGLRECRWEEPVRGPSEHPQLLEGGGVMGRIADLPADRGRLPDPVDLLITAGDARLGRFVLRPGARHTSIEERRVAVALGQLTGALLARLPGHDDGSGETEDLGTW